MPVDYNSAVVVLHCSLVNNLLEDNGQRGLWQSLSSPKRPEDLRGHDTHCARRAGTSTGTTHTVHLAQASLDVIFRTAQEMEAVKRQTDAAHQLDGFIMSTLFYEPSTRTRLSFESAMTRLGGTVLSTESAGQYSSAAKGETLEGARYSC